MRKETIFLLMAWFMAGCTPDFDDVWLVKDLRVLALRATPPEVLLADDAQDIPAVHIDGLIVDPTRPDALFDWQVWICSAEKNRCEDAAVKQMVQSNRTRLAEIEVDVDVSLDFLQQAKFADPFRGFGGVPVLVELTIADQLPVTAVKRVVYGSYVPATKTPNANPILSDVSYAPGQRDVTGQSERIENYVTLEPQIGGDPETYWVETFTDSVTGKELTEYYTYSFFVSAGVLSHGQTGGKPSAFFENKKVTDIRSEWTLPQEPKELFLWVVVRDDRGGVQFISRSFPAGWDFN
jgi:hypothetical protein